MLSRKETEVSRPVRPELSQRSIEIVTAQHNDYTGPEKLISRARIRRESPIKILKGALTYLEPNSNLSRTYLGRFHHALQYRISLQILEEGLRHR
jgi:hypothetical protein